jgi:hypothetical protein
MYKLVTVLFSLFTLEACDLGNHGDVICSEIFASVTIEVKGKVLTDYYTVRTSTEEVVRHEMMFGDSIYTVLDDNYVNELKNEQDTFVFYGYYRGVLVVEETFVIEADECHVQKISGKESVVI